MTSTPDILELAKRVLSNVAAGFTAITVSDAVALAEAVETLTRERDEEHAEADRFSAEIDVLQEQKSAAEKECRRLEGLLAKSAVRCSGRS